jgi:hypothetical protein
VTAITYIKQIAAEPCCTRTLLAQGILWAEASCRIDGTMAMALRNGSIDSGIRLLNLISFECGTIADAARWLNENRPTVLDVLSRSATKPNYTAIPIVFKIETYSVRRGWTDDPNFLGHGCIENDNRWATEYEAEAACEELHNVWGCPRCNLRVVPVS